MDDNVPLESIANSEDDILDPFVANTLEDAIYSGADPDDTSLDEDADDEE